MGGDRRIPSYSGDYRYAREDKDVDVQLLLFESFGGCSGRGSPSLRSVPRYVSPLSGHAILRRQGKRGRGTPPGLILGCDCLQSRRGGQEDKNI